MESSERLHFPRGPLLVFVGFVVVGTLVGAVYPYPEWALWKRIVFGMGMGGFCGSILTFSRIIRD